MNQSKEHTFNNVPAGGSGATTEEVAQYTRTLGNWREDSMNQFKEHTFNNLPAGGYGATTEEVAQYAHTLGIGEKTALISLLAKFR